MSPRIVAGAVGVITVLLGVYGLLSPAGVLDFVGFTPAVPTDPALAYGEARAIYGGLFTVLGAFTLWGAIDPPGKRSALLMAGLIWLGVCAGRLVGVSIDGNPGFMGWFNIAGEAALGMALVWSTLAKLPMANAQVQQ